MDRKKLAVLHVAKKQLGLDDETYRDVLAAHGGVSSSADLDDAGFLNVVRHFESCGFVSRFNPGAQKKQRAGMATDKQIKKIYALWWSMPSYYQKGKEIKALRGFLQKRFRVDHENFLTFGKAHQVIEALKKIGTRMA
jgi:hypothetical protein